MSYADAKVQTEVVHFVSPPGWQPCSEHRLLHWTGDFIGMSAPYHHLLSVIGVSEGRTVLHNDPTMRNSDGPGLKRLCASFSLFLWWDTMLD